jgi:hypothetical protein
MNFYGDFLQSCVENSSFSFVKNSRFSSYVTSFRPEIVGWTIFVFRGHGRVQGPALKFPVYEDQMVRFFF